MRTFKDFTSAYLYLVEEIRDDYDYISSPRGMKVKEKLGVRFEITNPRHRIPYVPARKFKIQYMIAETLWYLSGNNETEWIANYAPFWKDISDDGITANSAYGARIFGSHPRVSSGNLNQWEYVINELRNDPDSRRAMIHIRTPDDSIIGSKDVPCTIALQFFIRDNKLHQVVSMRSSDLVLGISYDVPAFTFLQELMANELGVELGTYIHISNSLHVYERHFEMLDEILDKHSSATSTLMSHVRGQMDPMPQTPATSELFAFEALIRECSDVSEMQAALATIKDLDSYWADWAYVLAAHRAGKLGLRNVARAMMYGVTEQLRPVRE